MNKTEFMAQCGAQIMPDESLDNIQKLLCDWNRQREKKHGFMSALIVGNMFIEACSNGDVKQLEKKHMQEYMSTYKTVNTGLAIACDNKQLEVCVHLISHGADWPIEADKSFTIDLYQQDNICWHPFGPKSRAFILAWNTRMLPMLSSVLPVLPIVMLVIEYL